MLLVPADRVAVHRVLEPLELSLKLIDSPLELPDARILDRTSPQQASEQRVLRVRYRRGALGDRPYVHGLRSLVAGLGVI